jgi:hypothetical protein
MNKVYSAKPAAPVEPSMVHKMHEGAGNDNSQYVDDQYQKAQVRTPEVHTPYKLKTASRTDIFDTGISRARRRAVELGHEHAAAPSEDRTA